MPSPSSAFRYLEHFHDEEQEKRRVAPGAPKAFIPEPNAALRGLSVVNRGLMAFAGAQGVDGPVLIERGVRCAVTYSAHLSVKRAKKKVLESLIPELLATDLAVLSATPMSTPGYRSRSTGRHALPAPQDKYRTEPLPGVYEKWRY